MKAVFLDRDGVINRNLDGYVRCVEDFELIPGSADAIAALSAAGFATVVVTNQSQVGRGITPRANVDAINRHMCREVERHGGRIDLVQTCYHAPGDGCQCRKPGPGLILEAAAGLGVDLGASYMVGDAISDLEAGSAAGCQPLLVLTGRGLGQLLEGRANSQARHHGVIALPDLAAAAGWILERERVSPARLVA